MTTTTHRMVRFLASVTSEAEARLAAGQGADIIDCKNPSEGALGALPPIVVTAIRKAVPPHILVSATIGDLPADPGRVTDAARAMAETGCNIVKVGFFPGGDAHATIRRLGADLVPATSLVAVLIADAPLDLALVSAFGDTGFEGVMLDTASKDGRTLLDHRCPEEIQAFTAAARAAGLFAGLAGSLRLHQIPQLLAFEPDVLGFRGALCEASDRRGALSASAIASVRRAIPQRHRTSADPALERTL